MPVELFNNQEKALVGSFSVIVKSWRTFVWSSTFYPLPLARCSDTWVINLSFIYLIMINWGFIEDLQKPVSAQCPTSLTDTPSKNILYAVWKYFILDIVSGRRLSGGRGAADGGGEAAAALHQHHHLLHRPAVLAAAGRPLPVPQLPVHAPRLPPRQGMSYLVGG